MTVICWNIRLFRVVSFKYLSKLLAFLHNNYRIEDIDMYVCIYMYNCSPEPGCICWFSDNVSRHQQALRFVMSVNSHPVYTGRSRFRKGEIGQAIVVSCSLLDCDMSTISTAPSNTNTFLRILQWLGQLVIIGVLINGKNCWS